MSGAAIAFEAITPEEGRVRERRVKQSVRSRRRYRLESQPISHPPGDWDCRWPEVWEHIGLVALVLCAIYWLAGEDIDHE